MRALRLTENASTAQPTALNQGDELPAGL